MSSCFSCGRELSSNIRLLLTAYKDQYDKKRIVRYFYKLETNGTVFICRSSSFNIILENEIKPSFSKGAEFAHISEFR